MSNVMRGLRAAFTIKAEDVRVSTTFNITLTIVSATRIDALIDVGGAARYLVDFWLVDAITTPNDRTLIPPTGDDTVEWSKLTVADGTYNHSIINTASPKTWYLVAVWAGQYTISDAITF